MTDIIQNQYRKSTVPADILANRWDDLSKIRD
jgi:hypothetical protein